jgi:hypothetical protein
LFQAEEDSAQSPTTGIIGANLPATRDTDDESVGMPIVHFDWRAVDASAEPAQQQPQQWQSDPVPPQQWQPEPAPPQRWQPEPMPPQQADAPPSPSSRRPSPGPRSNGGRHSARPIEQGFQAAQRAAAAAADITGDGLPQRTPMENLVPGSVETDQTQRNPVGDESAYRDPAAVGATYAAYARGLATRSSMQSTDRSRDAQ